MNNIIKDLEQRMQSMYSAVAGEVGGIRSNRPSPQLVEDLKIDYMGTPMVVKQLGSISIVPPRELVISLWDPAGAGQVAKAIDDAKRGFTTSVRGSSIHINLPALTEERRNELSKLVKQIIEKARIQLRSLRDDANKKIQAGKASKMFTEDMERQGKKKIQDVADKMNKEIDALLEKKIKEISE
jgi:ribosome recycling factor